MNPLPASPRKVLFLGFWSFDDPLTTSTIMPGLRVLLDELGVERVILATMEREGNAPLPSRPPIRGLELSPWRANRSRYKNLARAYDIAMNTRRLVRLVRKERVDLIIARASTAGTFGYWVGKATGVPLVVESFEPHADYMADCGEWGKGGAAYRSAFAMEQREIRSARFLITVAHSYREALITRGTDPSRVLVAPCPVDLDRFRPDPSARERVRGELGLGDAITGVYAGKFGGLYHKEYAFAAFAQAHRHFNGRFKLIVLTPDDRERVSADLKEAGFPLEDAFVTRVPHDQVPAYLNAADMAFAMYKRTPSSAYLSPVKLGEYWATGLPVLLTRGVADDGDIITGHRFGGALFDPEGNDLPAALEKVTQLIAEPTCRSEHRALAEHYRSLDHTREAYRTVFRSFGSQP